MRIIIAWELGNNFGHLLRQLPIALALRQRGHDILFAVKDVTIAQQTLHEKGFPFLQVPMARSKQPPAREIVNYSDILTAHGFAEYDVLYPLIQAWRHLYCLYRPDAVIIDHAPVALCAARLEKLPTSEIGMGFNLPPPISPYPCFKPGVHVPRHILLQSEAKILANLNRIRESCQQPALEHIPDLMSSDMPLLTTFQELDHYPERENGQYLGAICSLDEGFPVEWPVGNHKNIFVYLRPHAAVEQILDVLRQTDANIICVIPGLDSTIETKYKTATLHIYRTALKLAPLLDHCDLAITFAGHGLVSACLLRGIPMLVLPTQTEQFLISNSLIRLGAGLRVDLGEATASQFATTLNRLLTDPGFANRARAFAKKYATYNQNDVIERIADTIERLPGEVEAIPPRSRAILT